MDGYEGQHGVYTGDAAHSAEEEVLSLSQLVLKWVDDPERINYKTHRIIYIPDAENNHTLYHRALHAFFAPYRTNFYDGHEMSNEDQVARLIDALYTSLDTPVPDGEHLSPDERGKTFIEVLLRGRVVSMRKTIPEYTHEGLREKIRRIDAGCPYDRNKPDELVIELLARVARVGIYVLDANRQDLYFLECHEIMSNFKQAIVLLYNRGDEKRPSHFLCVALIPNYDVPFDESETLENAVTLFNSNHPFIEALEKRAQQQIAEYVMK